MLRPGRKNWLHFRVVLMLIFRFKSSRKHEFKKPIRLIYRMGKNMLTVVYRENNTRINSVSGI